MELQCPYCQSPIPPTEESSNETVCEACGSSFHLLDDPAKTTIVTSHTLGKFELLEKVGVGAFGAVWKARDTELGRIVAIKLLHPSIAGSSSDRERFFREARSLRLARMDGYRSQVQDRLREAQRLSYPKQSIAELRQEAVACLGDFVGLQPIAWDGFPEGTEISSVAVNPDATEVAVGLNNGTVLVRDLTAKTDDSNKADETARNDITELREHGSEIIGLDFVLGGREIVSAERNGDIKIWSPVSKSTWQCRQTVSTGSAIGGFSITPDARHCVT